MGMQWDDRDFRRQMAKFPGQVMYAAANAMNRSAEDANAALRTKLSQEFTIRQKSLVRYVAPVQLPKPNRATRERLIVVLQTEDAGRILNPYQYGIPKRAKSAEEPVAIPTKQLRHTPQTLIPSRWFPQNLGLTPKRDPQGHKYFALGKNSIKHARTPQHVTKAGKVQIKGKNRTFVLDPTLHDGVTMRQWGVYQRIGPKREDVRMLWRYTRQVPRPPILAFYETVVTTFNQRYPVNFRGAFAQAMRTAR